MEYGSMDMGIQDMGIYMGNNMRLGYETWEGIHMYMHEVHVRDMGTGAQNMKRYGIRDMEYGYGIGRKDHTGNTIVVVMLFMHTHTCPWLKKMASTTPSTELSRSAESNTMKGDLPPSSREIFFPEPAMARRSF